MRGVVGARLPSRVHMIAKTGDSRMIHTGSIEPIQLDGAVHPKIDQFILSSEKTASTVKICWKSDQNTAFAMNSGMNARTRVRSTGSTSCW